MSNAKMVGMTPDIEQIRAVVTTATTGGASARRDVARQRLGDNAASWLIALCDEIERLRAEALAKWATVEAERDAFRDECERLRERSDSFYTRIVDEENERFRQREKEDR